MSESSQSDRTGNVTVRVWVNVVEQRFVPEAKCGELLELFARGLGDCHILDDETKDAFRTSSPHFLLLGHRCIPTPARTWIDGYIIYKSSCSGFAINGVYIPSLGPGKCRGIFLVSEKNIPLLLQLEMHSGVWLDIIMDVLICESRHTHDELNSALTLWNLHPKR